MTRLIDADSLLEKIKSLNHKEVKYGDWIYTDELVNIITNAPTVQRDGWVSVEDRLPEGFDSVIAYGKIKNDLIATVNEAYMHKDKWLSVRGSLELKGVTHWQPLPAAPTDTE